MPRQVLSAKAPQRKSTGRTGPKQYAIRKPPPNAAPINVENKIYAGTKEGHQYEWFKFDIVDPVFWHVERDPPPHDLTEYVAFKKGDRLTCDPNTGNPLLIPLHQYG